MLATPDWNRPFVVHTDASQYATGATLTQPDADGIHRVIAYTSTKLNSAQQNYSANDRELLGLVTALLQFRCYLEG